MKTAKKKKTKARKSEPLVWKVSARVNPRAFPGHDPRELGRQAIELYSRTGAETPGIELTGHWRNPSNRNPLHSNWKTSRDIGQSLAGFFRTIIERTHAATDQIRFDYASEQERAKAEALREKRSAAAVEGWITRRKNIELERRRLEGLRRSQAAKRGAETRRRNREKGKKNP